MNKNTSRLLCGASTVLALALSAPAMAQGVAAAASAQNTGNAADIVVTARRNSEALLNVPVAVTAVTSDTVVRSNIANLSSVSAIVPFVQITKAPAGTGALFQIRGIGSPVGDPGIQQTVLTNIDNVLITRGRAINSALFDVAQIEVLKGPQALFFGRNSTAGVLSVTSASPGHTLAGYIRGGYEFEARERYVDAAVDLPIAPTLAVRLAGHVQGIRGFIRNNAVAEPYLMDPTGALPSKLTGAERPTRDFGSDTAGRVTVKWDPVDQFSATVKYTRSHNTGGGDADNYVAFCKPSNVHPSADLGGFGGPVIPDLQNSCQLGYVMNVNRFPAGLTAGMRYAEDGRDYGKTDVDVLSAALHYDAGNIAIDSVTGYFNQRSVMGSNFDAASFSLIHSILAENAHSFSEELRLTTQFDGPLNIVAGGYYGRDRVLNDTYAMIFLAGPSAPGAGDTTGSNQTTYYTYNFANDAKTTAVSGFAQVRYKPTDNIEISAGGRYTREEKTGVFTVPYESAAATASGFLPSGTVISHDRTYTNFSPEAVITWHPTADQTVYATYHSGYKSGGFSVPQVPVGTFNKANSEFSPEKAKGFEVGYKAALLDRRVSVELVAYRYEFDNLQVSSFDPATFSFVAGNAGKSRTTGLEAQVNARVIPGLQLGAALGYNDAKYVSFPSGPCYVGQATLPVGSVAAPGQCVAQPLGAGAPRQNLSGYTMPRAPHWQGMFTADYEVPLTGDVTLHLNGRVKFSSSYKADDYLIPDPTTTQKAYALLDLGAEISKGGLSFGIQGQNLTNKLTQLYTQGKAYGRAGDYVARIGRNRQIRLTAGYKF